MNKHTTRVIGAPVTDWTHDPEQRRPWAEAAREYHAARGDRVLITSAEPTARPVLARSTIDATIFVIQQKNPERLRRWIEQHTPQEQDAIKRLVVEVARRRS